MVDLTQASDAEIGGTVDAFAAALEAKPVVLPAAKLERILLALDESNQGAAAERYAQALARRHRASVLLLYAYDEGPSEARREHYLTERAESMKQSGIELAPFDSAVRSDHDARSFEQILAPADTARCALVVIAAPYLDDYEKLGEHSVGATLDVLVCRSHAPLLVVRSPEVQPETSLADALREAAAVGAQCHVSIARGERLETLVERGNRGERLLVLPVGAGTGERAYALGAVRNSRNPLLIVGENAADPGG